MSYRHDATTPRTEREFLDDTARIILDKAIVVHSRLGPGLLESVYRTCLTHELRKAGEKVETEQLVPIVYDGVELDGYRLDMLVNDAVIVEVKTVEGLLPVHHAQLLSYLRLLDKRLGLLINFKVPQVMQGVKRVVNDFCFVASWRRGGETWQNLQRHTLSSSVKSAPSLPMSRNLS